MEPRLERRLLDRRKAKSKEEACQEGSSERQFQGVGCLAWLRLRSVVAVFIVFTATVCIGYDAFGWGVDQTAALDCQRGQDRTSGRSQAAVAEPDHFGDEGQYPEGPTADQHQKEGSRQTRQVAVSSGIQEGEICSLQISTPRTTSQGDRKIRPRCRRLGKGHCRSQDQLGEDRGWRLRRSQRSKRRDGGARPRHDVGCGRQQGEGPTTCPLGDYRKGETRGDGQGQRIAISDAGDAGAVPIPAGTSCSTWFTKATFECVSSTVRGPSKIASATKDGSPALLQSKYTEATRWTLHRDQEAMYCGSQAERSERDGLAGFGCCMRPIAISLCPGTSDSHAHSNSVHRRIDYGALVRWPDPFDLTSENSAQVPYGVARSGSLIVTSYRDILFERVLVKPESCPCHQDRAHSWHGLVPAGVEGTEQYRPYQYIDRGYVELPYSECYRCPHENRHFVSGSHGEKHIRVIEYDIKYHNREEYTSFLTEILACDVTNTLPENSRETVSGDGSGSLVVYTFHVGSRFFSRTFDDGYIDRATTCLQVQLQYVGAQLLISVEGCTPPGCVAQCILMDWDWQENSQTFDSGSLAETMDYLYRRVKNVRGCTRVVASLEFAFSQVLQGPLGLSLYDGDRGHDLNRSAIRDEGCTSWMDQPGILFAFKIFLAMHHSWLTCLLYGRLFVFMVRRLLFLNYSGNTGNGLHDFGWQCLRVAAIAVLTILKALQTDKHRSRQLVVVGRRRHQQCPRRYITLNWSAIWMCALITGGACH